MYFRVYIYRHCGSRQSNMNQQDGPFQHFYVTLPLTFYFIISPEQTGQLSASRPSFIDPDIPIAIQSVLPPVLVCCFFFLFLQISRKISHLNRRHLGFFVRFYNSQWALSMFRCCEELWDIARINDDRGIERHGRRTKNVKGNSWVTLSTGGPRDHEYSTSHQQLAEKKRVHLLIYDQLAQRFHNVSAELMSRPTSHKIGFVNASFFFQEPFFVLHPSRSRNWYLSILSLYIFASASFLPVYARPTMLQFWLP